MAKRQKSYFELTEHNSLQVLTFLVVFIIGALIFFRIMLTFLDGFFVDFLNGRVFNDNDIISYSLDNKEPTKLTNLYFSWAVDIYADTTEEARYWFNPALSLFIPAATFAFALALIISSLLPGSLGFIRQKIDREISNYLDRISHAKYGHLSDQYYEEIINDLISADLRDFNDLEELWKIPAEDLRILHKAVIWKFSSGFYKLLHVNNGFRLYMRSYFTAKYGNAVLGFVYIGAAILIIIIGLRGLKFIPPTQPSLVLFALGLEFSLLITYAVTLIYTRQEEGQEKEKNNSQPESLLLSGDFSSSKEIESLLRVFVKKNKLKSD